VDGTQYAAFGHGTMVAGILHLVAPTAKILPLKSFQSDGTANLSDIIRAVYYATQNNANVINMSFNLTAPSQELASAITNATNDNVICVASSGNDGQQEVVYPAALQDVMGVASTNNSDQRSTFSNYGNQIVWVAAPGEAIVTTYPFGFYAAGWGTSFSSPEVAGTASLVFNVLNQNVASQTTTQVLNVLTQTNQTLAAGAISHAKWIGPNMGYGRLDIYATLSSLNPIQGLLH
jgi:subtilisin family serine protease